MTRPKNVRHSRDRTMKRSAGALQAMKTYRANREVPDVDAVVWGSAGALQAMKTYRANREVPDVDAVVWGSAVDPAVKIEIYGEHEGAWKPTGTFAAFKMSELNRTASALPRRESRSSR